MLCKTLCFLQLILVELPPASTNENGADPYIQDKDGRTHLEIANQNNKTDAAQIIKDAMSKKISIILR